MDGVNSNFWFILPLPSYSSYDLFTLNFCRLAHGFLRWRESSLKFEWISCCNKWMSFFFIKSSSNRVRKNYHLWFVTIIVTYQWFIVFFLRSPVHNTSLFNWMIIVHRGVKLSVLSQCILLLQVKLPKIMTFCERPTAYATDYQFSALRDSTRTTLLWVFCPSSKIHLFK